MINSIYGLNNISFGNLQSILKNQNLNTKESFSKILESSVNKINDYQKIADNSVISFIKGDENEIHNVMIAMEEAKLTMQTAIEVRNKLVEAYQELSRVQI